MRYRTVHLAVRGAIRARRDIARASTLHCVSQTPPEGEVMAEWVYGTRHHDGGRVGVHEVRVL